MEINSFEDLNLEDSLLKALNAIDYTTPSPIQARAIPVALTGVDLIGQAQTGTGKTAAFGIPMIQNISKSGRYTKGLVLCPTRELCIQVTNELKKLAHFTKNISVFAIYGGDPINPQIKALKAGVDIVVGTPGRVMDHLSRGTLLLDGLEILTLDEADEMLNMGFREDLETILQSVPEHRQTILFSATMPKAILDITHLYQKNPQLIKVTPTNLTSASVEQFYIETDLSHRLKVLTYMLNADDYAQAIVFCNTKAKVDELSNELAENLVKNDVLHGDLGQEKRNRILNKFRKGEFKVLVATDVAARGIDVPNVDLVCNYDVPFDPEYYVHRIGRTGRAGKEGKAYSFLAGSRDKRLLRQIESFAKVKVEQYKLPTAAEIARLELEKVKTQLTATVLAGKEVVYLDLAKELMNEGEPANIIAALLLKIIPPGKHEWAVNSVSSRENRERRNEKQGSNKRKQDREWTRRDEKSQPPRNRGKDKAGKPDKPNSDKPMKTFVKHENEMSLEDILTSLGLDANGNNINSVGKGKKKAGKKNTPEDYFYSSSAREKEEFVPAPRKKKKK